MKKSVSKRIKVTGTGKMLRRPMAVDHFRSKKSGQKLLLKKRSRIVSRDFEKKIRQLLSINQ